MHYKLPMDSPDPPAASRTWAAVVGGLVVAGTAVGRAARWVGRSTAEQYNAIDPDLRKHFAQLPALGITQLLPVERVPVAKPDDGARPVLFVHGLGGTAGNFTPMRAWFRLHGRTRTYSVPVPNEDTLDAMAAAVCRYVDTIYDVNQLDPTSQIDVVAHSMGGVIARLALLDPAFASRVHTLVTLGSPHAGTWLARYASTPRTIALRPASPEVARLEAQEPWTGPVRLVCFWSSADMMLLPPSAACVAGAENIEVREHGHNGYLLHPRAWTAVMHAIAPGR